MPNYKNKSKFYKQLTISGKRINVPPGQVFFSDRDLGSTYDFLELVNDSPTFKPKTEEPKKVEVVEKSDYRKLEKAILILNDKIEKMPKQIQTLIDETLESTPAVEQEELERLAQKLQEIEKIIGDNDHVANIAKEISETKDYIKNTIERRQEILKNAIEEINQAVASVEKYVYEGDWNNLPIVIEDEKKEEKKSDVPSIEDILKGTK